MNSRCPTLFFYTILLLLVGCCPKISEQIEVRERIVEVPVPGDTVIVETAGRIDTVMGSPVTETLAFVARLDTTVRRTELKLAYRHPENLWNVKIVRIDTVRLETVRDSIIERVRIERVPVTPVWVLPLVIVFGIVGVALIVWGIRR